MLRTCYSKGNLKCTCVPLVLVVQLLGFIDPVSLYSTSTPKLVLQPTFSMGNITHYFLETNETQTFVSPMSGDHIRINENRSVTEKPENWTWSEETNFTTPKLQQTHISEEMRAVEGSSHGWPGETPGSGTEEIRTRWPPHQQTSQTGLPKAGKDLTFTAAGIDGSNQSESSVAPVATGAMLPASSDNSTQQTAPNSTVQTRGKGNITRRPIGGGLGHKPINFPALHMYRKLRESSDSSGAEFIAIFGLILCILFIICIFTVELSTVRRGIKRIRYRRLGRSIHLDTLEPAEATAGWQRL